jgi:hypothetical protein
MNFLTCYPSDPPTCYPPGTPALYDLISYLIFCSLLFSLSSGVFSGKEHRSRPASPDVSTIRSRPDSSRLAYESMSPARQVFSSCRGDLVTSRTAKEPHLQIRLPEASSGGSDSEKYLSRTQPTSSDGPDSDSTRAWFETHHSDSSGPHPKSET